MTNHGDPINVQPCPRCGSHPVKVWGTVPREQEGRFWWQCDNTDCELMGPRMSTEDQAREGWNGLRMLTVDDLMDALRERQPVLEKIMQAGMSTLAVSFSLASATPQEAAVVLAALAASMLVDAERVGLHVISFGALRCFFEEMFARQCRELIRAQHGVAESPV